MHTGRHQEGVIAINYKLDTFKLAAEDLGLAWKSPIGEKSGLHPAEDVGICSWPVCSHNKLNPNLQFSEVQLPPHAGHDRRRRAHPFHWKIRVQVSPRPGEAGTCWAPRHRTLAGVCSNMPTFSSPRGWKPRGGPGAAQKVTGSSYPQPLSSCRLLEHALFGRGGKGTCTATLTKEPVRGAPLPSARSSEGPAQSRGALTPKGGQPCEPVPAWHPLQRELQTHNWAKLKTFSS